ncbi:type II secretion system minor pseudopilin GspH [Vibrio metoecus]|uniref:Type II secretion system protein H n=1 Tax=Vibrio metoecus TaxID=1481663 RepID=A0A0Q0MWQ0_VIBMT|nr:MULTISPECIES: type II secretion system minor pseudopilin GspH [Vibrio]KQA24371.1 general secretion pathway protein GspH [Vibrio metoecus]KQB10965.1 general secretion pathway protein GspH [Vibrio metoecus]MCR9385654.1 type II secretion system minor pseudopilin GspH [Vibrio metoecus]MDP4491527.1 type II secretion system minor pseudopilin GspH [Vibrio sp. AH4]PAR21599.1 type II secretion system protein GspH [Vibrio metoecus]
MTATRGFTLLEILLVLVLISVSAVAVIATFPVSVKDEAKISAQSFYQRLLLLNEEAILSGQDFGVRVDVDARSLTFLQLTADKGWQKWQNDKMTNQTTLKDGLQLDFELGGGAWQKDDRLFNPGSLFDEEMFADKKEEKQEPPPQLFVLSSGEVTPFVLSVFPKGQPRDEQWRVEAQENGTLRLLAPGDSDEK